MNITKLEIKKINKEDSDLKANVNITFDHAIEVREIKLICKNEGYFIAMPSREYVDKKTGEKKYAEFVNISQFYKNYLRDIIVKKYKSMFTELSDEFVKNDIAFLNNEVETEDISF